MSNLAAVMPELGRIEVQEVPLREPGPREVRVRVRAVGVCGSDTAYYRIGRIGDWIVDGPIILGHEAAGEVVAVGEAVTRVQVGDRVAIEPGTPCRDCADCHAGDYHLCPGLTFLSRDAEAWSTFCGPSGRGRARPAPAQSVRSATGRAGRHDPGGTRPPTGGDPAGPPGPDPVTRLSGRAGRVPAALSARGREFREWATEVGGRTSRCRQER